MSSVMCYYGFNYDAWNIHIISQKTSHCTISLYICFFFFLPLQHRFMTQKFNHTTWHTSLRVPISDQTCLNAPAVFMIREQARDEVYEAALNATQGSVFFPAVEGRERGGVGAGIWLLSPHPQCVRGGFRKKGTKTWDAEITRDGNIQRSLRGGVAHGLL